VAATNETATRQDRRGPGVYLAQTAFVIVLGALVAWAGSDNAETAGGIGLRWWVAAVAFAINWVAFVPAYLRQTEHYYDLVGSLTYLTTTVLALALSRPSDGRSWLLVILIVIWAGRLGTFLFRRVKAVGKDGRFDRIKQSPIRFLLAWSTQALWVIFTAAAAHAAIASSQSEPLGWVAAIGILVWIFGFAVEAAADGQKNRFRSDPSNQGRFIDQGLWAWSRHPNYFGEITLWVGVAIIALPALSGWQYVTLLSPVFVWALLTRASGIPLLERRADKRWGGQEDYEAYKARTPVLVLRPPR
jgi:steroid 5-alpha reductase family enzyme